jgi:L,D-transpeptidase YcbB
MIKIPLSDVRHWRSAVSGSLRAAVTTIIVIGIGGTAQSQDIRMGPVGDGPSTGNSDREFIKDWEGNPPPGFPTLASANVAATKAAVKRYEEIVKAGGWGVVPELELKAGQSHYGVKVLRERLKASGDTKPPSDIFKPPMG